MATFGKDDKLWLLNTLKTQRKLEEFETQVLVTSFDTETNFDIQKIKSDIEQTSILKRIAIQKTALYIPEYLLSLVLFPKTYRQKNHTVMKLYWKLLFNKIDIDSFDRQLREIATTY